MPILLDVPASVEQALKAARVTSTSVSPEQRFREERQGYLRDFQQACVDDAKAKAEAAVAPDGKHPTTVLEAQVGRPLSSDQVIARLKSLNPNFIFRRSIAFPHIMGIYYPDPTANLDSPLPDYRGLRFLFGFEAGFSPEFSVRHTKPDGTFDRETRGWRTVLARLIRNRLISKAGAEKAFGIPSRASRNWHLLTN